MKTLINKSTGYYFTLFTVWSGLLLGPMICGPGLVWAQEESPKEETPLKLEEPGEDGVKEEQPPKAPPKLPRPASSLNPETLRLMEMIDQKNKDLKKKEEELVIKEQALRNLEEKVMADLKKIEDAIAKSRAELGLRNEVVEKNMVSLVKVYSAMKPANAASLLSSLDEDVSVQILSRMKHKTAGQILGRMNPKVAKNISEKLAGKSLTQLPDNLGGAKNK